MAASDAPPDMDYEEGFVFNEEMIQAVAEKLSVKPEWARQGYYFAHDKNCFDEVCAWVLENHPRFVIVSTSNSPPPDSDCQLKMAFIVNATVCSETWKMAAEVAQAMMELCIQYKDDPSLADWRNNGAHKKMLQADNTDKLYNLKAVAEGYDLKYHYTSNIEDHSVQVGSRDVIVLVIYGDADDVDEVTEGLASV